MKVLVVDDEPLARRRLIRMLGRIKDVSVLDEAGDAESALAHIRSERPDLVLLDIEMPGLTGLELAASAENLPPIVFVTAYKQYALDGFEVSAVDYLVKPVRRERLAAAIEKVRQRSSLVDPARLESLLARLDRQVKTAEPSRLHARFGGTTRLVDASEITRIHASAKYALFRHEGREFVLDESINALEARLAGDGFLRVHRGELVNLSHVRALHTEDGVTTVELSDGQRASVSRRTVAALKERLGIAGSRLDPTREAVGGTPLPGGGVERRLAAILSADAVGYSRLMAEDEVATVRTITAHRDEIARLVREHRGRVVDSPGDNVLAEFASATNAVHCAVAIQIRLETRNAALAANRRMPFRIGIHLGEVMVDGSRIYGGGVNTAARLEGLAEPGAICISAMVHEQVYGKVYGKVDVTFDDAGEHTVKNIPKPVRVFRITPTDSVDLPR